jgi:metaxin
MGGRLPNLHLTSGQLLPAQLIPTWADETLNEHERPLEGYKDQAALDESRAWVSLLEGDVHAALVRAPCLSASFGNSPPRS